MVDRDRYIQPLRIYKPTKTGGGAASYWKLSVEKRCIWLELAEQIGQMDNNQAKFDWDNKLRFKCGVNDIGEMLAVFSGVKNGVGPMRGDGFGGLFHQTQKGNSVLVFVAHENNLYMKLSVKNIETSLTRCVAHNIAFGEAEVLRSLLEASIPIIYNWVDNPTDIES